MGGIWMAAKRRLQDGGRRDRLPHWRIPVLLVMSAAVAWAFVESLEEALYIPPEHPAIQYSKQPPDDRVARLIKKIDSGQVKLDYAPGGSGYLPALLKQLDVPVDSQVLVFSKTSIQASAFRRARRGRSISMTMLRSATCRTAMRWS